MNGWTHLSFWRLWFTCKAAATVRAPLSEIWLDLRLQNVRKQQIRSQKYSNVIKKSNINLHECICTVISNQIMQKSPPMKSWTSLHTKCMYLQVFLIISAHYLEKHYSVHFLRNVRTWITGLTLASEGYGSLATLQPIHRLQCLRSGSHWGCRMSENERWEVVQQPFHFV